MSRKFRIQKRFIQRNTYDEFLARYKGHEIYIQREGNSSTKPFYISVTAPDGSYCYDGWWGEPGCSTMQDAITQALTGSMLLAAANERGDGKR